MVLIKPLDLTLTINSILFLILFRVIILSYISSESSGFSSTAFVNLSLIKFNPFLRQQHLSAICKLVHFVDRYVRQFYRYNLFF